MHTYASSILLDNDSIWTLREKIPHSFVKAEVISAFDKVLIGQY